MIGPIVLLIILTFLNATFASAEIAVISSNETRLRHLAENNDKRAMKLVSLTEQPARFLATIQVAITLAGLLSSAFAAENFAGPLVTLLVNAGITISESILKSISLFFITLILAYFNLVFGELVPKRIAMKKAESMALGMAPMLYAVSKIFAPLVFLLTVSTNLILRILGIDPKADEDLVSEEEIRMMLMEGHKQGTIDAEESEMIKNVFELDDRTVEQICTHRIDVAALDNDDPLTEWEKTIHESRHTFYPVYSESTDNIIGILNTKDYFRLKDRTKKSIQEYAIDKAYYIPESMKANILFRQMKQSRNYFAVIVDEYGGMSGIITLHDLIESLVGELHEIEDTESVEAIRQISDNEWQIQGNADLDEVHEKLKVNLPIEIYDTFSGFICGEMGRVPDDNECFELETSGLKIQVHSILNHRIGNTTVCVQDAKPQSS